MTTQSRAVAVEVTPAIIMRRVVGDRALDRVRQGHAYAWGHVNVVHFIFVAQLGATGGGSKIEGRCRTRELWAQEGTACSICQGCWMKREE